MTTLIPKYDLGATGASNRPFNLKLAEFVSVKDFGATGNGTTDDTAAIQAAINACATRLSNVEKTPVAQAVYFPYGQYLITSPLNLTADNGAANRRGIRLYGEEASSGDYTYGSQLIGKTNGKAFIEIIDNDNFQLENLALVSASTSASTVGIYQARRTSGTLSSGWTGNCLYTNVTITFNNDTITLNDTFGTIGIINVAGEETTYDRCEVWANLPLALSWSNSMRKATDDLVAGSYAAFAYNPVWATQADITTGASNTVFRTKNCRFIAKGFNSPIVLLHEVGSVFSYGDFLQKRASTTGTDGTNGIGYEFWNAFQVKLDSTTESTKTPFLIHRGIAALEANIRGTIGTGEAKALIHYGIDAPSFTYNNSNVIFDYVGAIPDGLISYTTPTGVGANEPAVVTLANCNFSINQTMANATIDPKILYTSTNTNFNFTDSSFLANNRYIKMPLVSKSIGTPATTTSIFNVVFPIAIANFSGFSATVKANLHVSNAESETAGSPSSLYVDAMWQMVRNSVPSGVTVTTQTINNLTASDSAVANNITGLTLTSTLTGTDSIVLKVASIQTGANNAAAFISGYIEVYYAGGYSTAPVVSLL